MKYLILILLLIPQIGYSEEDLPTKTVEEEKNIAGIKVGVEFNMIGELADADQSSGNNNFDNGVGFTVKVTPTFSTEVGTFGYGIYGSSINYDYAGQVDLSTTYTLVQYGFELNYQVSIFTLEYQYSLSGSWKGDTISQDDLTIITTKIGLDLDGFTIGYSFDNVEFEDAGVIAEGNYISFGYTFSK